MSSTKPPTLPPELDDERQRTDESLQEERAKVDALLEPEPDAPLEEAREQATEALEGERERVDEELRKTPRKTVVEAVAAERERADETIAIEREHAAELERREHARSAVEAAALEEERLRTDQSLVEERKTTDATIVSQAERLQIVSHDLKNPLQSIVTSAAVIQKIAASTGPLDAERIRVSAERIERGARAMDRLIGDLLTSTSLELGSLPLTLELRDLRPLVDECVKTLAPLAAEKRLRLACRLPDGPLSVRFDAGRVSQSLCNVVANAIKFTPAGATVEVVLERADDEARLKVIDSGPGVPERDAQHIFERHFRGSAEPPTGLGLGLYIAKTIVDLHGGRIWYEPRKDAPSGSVFTITLPLAD